MTNKKICIIGTGGFGRETLTYLINSLSHTKKKIINIAVFMVNDKYYNETEIMGIPVIREKEFDIKKYKVVVAIGDPKKRKKVVKNLPKNTEFTTIIDPSAIISDWVEIGEGSIIAAGVTLTCNIKLGKHAQLNLNTTIGHDCVIKDYFTTAPATNISGNCKFGDSVYFGTNSSIREGITICDNVTIGMGAVVVKDINESGIYIGNPVKKLEKKIKKDKKMVKEKTLFFVDSISSDKANLLLEDKPYIFDLKYLPDNIKEGDYLDFEIKLNKSEKESVKNSVKGLLEDLTKQTKGEDFDI